MAESQFEIIEFKPFEKNTLRGFIDVRLPSGMVVHGLTLHEQNGKRWVGLPGKPYKDKAGKETWTPVLEIPDRDRRDKFQAAVLAALDRYEQAA